MRKVINKNLNETEILNAAEMLVGGGVESLKLYFMIGLPEEREEDARAGDGRRGNDGRLRPWGFPVSRAGGRLAMGSDGGCRQP